MTCTHPDAELLPFLINGTLPADDRRRVEAHAAGCAQCRADLGVWQDLRDAVQADAARLPGISGHAWQRLATRRDAATWGSRLRHHAALVAAQVRLVRHGLWLSSAVVIGIGFAKAWAFARQGAIGVVAPLAAVFGISHLYGPQNDPAFEMTRATPTSPRTVLLARLVLVFGYDLLLALAASAALGFVVPGTIVTSLIWSWLAPMTFLSAVALVCSVSMGSNTAMVLALGLWFSRGLFGSMKVPLAGFDWVRADLALWSRPAPLFVLAIALSACGVWLAGTREHRVGAGA
jgi:hypothetical protein